MHVRRTLGALAAAFAVVVTTAGCGAAGGSGDAVAYTDKICSAFIPIVETVSKPPQVSTTDPIAGSKTLSEYLAAAGGAVDKAITELDGVGKSPVAGGDEFVTKMKAAFKTFKSTFASAKSTLDSAPNTQQGKATAIGKAGTSLASLSSLPDPTADLKGNNELNTAAEKAANCQKIKTITK